MAVILVLVCSVIGFGSAIAALFVFDVSLLQAFTIWMSAGLVATVFAVLPALLPQGEPQDDRQAESA